MGELGLCRQPTSPTPANGWFSDIEAHAQPATIPAMVLPLILIDAPSTPPQAEAVTAIFADAHLNATIGNGNLLIS